ncbi:MAG TPA: hypothetical protein VHW44_11480 [Pseudonocardiaceae bacterium]|jgi:hypothetical protein|nr:hypothetical protein [Pseudonocardiaceae bacterium]
MSCPECVRELDHCHGTLLIHLDDQVECTDGDCTDLDQVRHVLVVSCDLVVGGCACQPEVELERQAS